jgi:FkbM family methyltransferase
MQKSRDGDEKKYGTALRNITGRVVCWKVLDMIDDVLRFDSSPDVAQAHDLLHRITASPPYVVPSKINKSLYLYGAGSLGRMAWDYFRKIEIPVAGVIDKNASFHKQDTFWSAARLLTPDEVPEDVKLNALLAICVVTSSWGEVTHPLREVGWRNILPFYTLCAGYNDIHPLDNGWLTGVLTEEDQQRMVDVLGRYADDISRAHHLQFTAWHALQQEWVFSDAPVTTDDRYFIPEIVSLIHDHEFFTDLGAHYGSVCAKFMEVVKGKFAGLVAVEADAANAAKLRKYIETLPPKVRSKIHTEEILLGSEEGSAQFESGLGYVSRIVARGGTNVTLHTFDKLALAPTFIKAHLEGGELDALLGGLQTIRRYRPIIALTVYHDRKGLWQTARRLMDELGGCGYRYLFRLHGWQGTGAVLYLIPDRRTTRFQKL